MSTGYVFVSYSRKQYYVAEQIAVSLSANGLPAWLDAQEIAPGADWQAAIDQGLANCAAFVLVASRSAYRSAAVQHEIAAAQAAGKPIYLAVIQKCPLVKRFKDSASIVDCRFQFEQQITTLARAIQSGQPHHDTISSRPLGDTMPFGRAKYLQLLVVALSYTVGTIALLINKQATINHTLPQQLIPLLVLIAAPASAWLIGLFYSWYLVFAFRLQRPVSFAALEIWPVLNLVLIPALFFFLDLGILIRLTQDQQILHEGATYLNYYLTIDDRFGAYSLVFWALVLIPYAAVLLSEIQRSLMLFFASLAILFPAALPVPTILKVSMVSLLTGVLFALLLWDFFRGKAVQNAFDGENFLPTNVRGFVIAMLVAVIITPIWFLPIHITLRLMLIAVVVTLAPLLYMRAFFRRIRRPDSKAEIKSEIKADRQWARWLIPGAFNTDQFHSIRTAIWRRVTPGAAPTTVPWSVLYAASDAAAAREIRQVFVQYPAFHEVEPQQARYHLLVISNTTPRRWIAQQDARFPRSICVITAPVNIKRLGIALQLNQFVDYRLRRPAALRYLAQALTGEPNYVNPILPEDFSRSRGPYPIRLVGLGLRLLGALNLLVGIGALSIMRLANIPQLSSALAALSIALGAWCFWEAERLQMQRTTLATLLLTGFAALGSLGYWLFSGALSTLAPHGMSIQNDDINGRISTALLFILTLVCAPIALFVTVALVEFVRNFAVLRRWLPGIAWPGWRQKLAVSAMRNINLSYGVYALGVLLAVLVIFTDSPFHYPRFHEYDLPSANIHAQRFSLAPNGNLWFEMCHSVLVECDTYQIGYITPSGQLHTDYYSISQPSGCSPFDCISGADFRLGPDGSVWFATSQGSFDKTVFIVKLTPDGRIHRFPLPSGTYIPNLYFAFDAAGNLWYTRQTPHSLTSESDAVGRIDRTNHADEFSLPDNSAPISLLQGPDGNMWMALAGKSAIARITPTGAITTFALPDSIEPVEMLIGPDHKFWFTAPRNSIIGRMSLDGTTSLTTLPAHTNPVDLTVGADGTLWYFDFQNDLTQETIGHIKADGSVRTYHIAALFTSGSTLAAAPDGSMWLTLYNKIAHIALDGSVRLYDVPTLDADLGEAILVGPHLWFSEYTGVIGDFVV